MRAHGSDCPDPARDMWQQVPRASQHLTRPQPASISRERLLHTAAPIQACWANTLAAICTTVAGGADAAPPAEQLSMHSPPVLVLRSFYSISNAEVALLTEMFSLAASKVQWPCCPQGGKPGQWSSHCDPVQPASQRHWPSSPSQ